MSSYRDQYTLPTLSTVFNKILDRDGVLDPEAMHDEFSNPKHPLHSRYEWDNRVAGRAHRVDRIRADIRLVRIKTVNQSTGEAEAVRAYSSRKYSQGEDARGYVETSELVADPIAAKLLERRLIRQIAILKQHFSHLNNFIQIVRTELLDEEGGAA